MNTNVPLYKIPIATTVVKGRVFLFSKLKEAHVPKGSRIKKQPTSDVMFVYNTSRDGFTFSATHTEIHFFKGKTEISPDDIISFKIFPGALAGATYTMTLELVDSSKSVGVFTALSKDLKKWIVKAPALPVPFAKLAVHVPKIKGRTRAVTYYSDRELWITTKKGSMWNPSSILINPRIDAFDSEPLEGMSYMPEKEGMYIIYSSQAFSGNSVDMRVGAILCSHKDPEKVLWRSTKPLWQGHFDKAEYLVPIGGEKIKKHILLYWMDIRGGLIVVKLEKDGSGSITSAQVHHPKGPLKRAHKNPIIEPRSQYDWEADGTFNPAAFLDARGTVHLLYRAIGSDGISRIGYAQSRDGIHFTRRSSGPVFQPTPGYGLPHPEYISGPTKYNPLFYTSGGSWGGSEDPRAVHIDETVYMMYVAFEGWNSVRMALTSILEKDLQQGHWKWRKPVHISPPGEINKNWVLFPEKIQGKYAMLHSIAPKVSIEYIDNLSDFDGTFYIRSERPQGPQPGRSGYWDSLLRGAGPPPIRTKKGWLLLYHALDKNDAGKYKLGAMILDIKNPSKVLYRSNNPLLTPDMSYENEGKPGVVYASGALIKDHTLYIYYGGGDRVVCVATAPIDEFLDFIMHGKAPQLAFSRVDVH